MFDTVLIADRGASAVRVIAACQRLGAKSVVAHVDGDRAALAARRADERIALGRVRRMDHRAVLEAAAVSGAQAIHPGAGPLALDAAFARAVREAGLSWLGAPPDRLGARPDPPSGRGVCLEGTATSWAIVGAWEETVRWDGRVLVAEFAAAPAQDAPPGPAGGIATVYGETLWPTIAVQDRLVELTTGVDLVERQLRTACGERVEPLPSPRGHAIQAHVYAAAAARVPVTVTGWVPPDEDNLRVDTVLAEGAELTKHDGPLLATLTAWGADRAQALDRLVGAVGAALRVQEPPVDPSVLSAVLAGPDVV
ncbi:hypothetical protein BH20ACT5_BH20ACT5_08160 [soil metagenome]